MGQTRRSRRVGAALTAIVVAAPCLLTLWEFRHDVRIDRKLRKDGVVVDGEVVERRTRGGRGSLLFGRNVGVRFTTAEGRSVETTVTVQDLPRAGATKVRYLRTDPSVARLVSDPVPRRDNWWLVLGATGLGLSAVVVIKRIQRRRRSRRAGRTTSGPDS